MQQTLHAATLDRGDREAVEPLEFLGERPDPAEVIPLATDATGPRGPRIQHVPHDSQQTHIALAWSVPAYRFDASYEATAALSVLGGGSSSRLFMEVRERRGLCYSVSAGYHTARDFAAAVCYSGTTAERAQETLDVMLAEIRRLPGSIEEEELLRVKARAKSGHGKQQEPSCPAGRSGCGQRSWCTKQVGHGSADGAAGPRVGTGGVRRTAVDRTDRPSIAARGMSSGFSARFAKKRPAGRYGPASTVHPPTSSGQRPSTRSRSSRVSRSTIARSSATDR